MPRLYGPGPGEPEPLLSVRDLSGMAVDDAAGQSTGEIYGALAEAESGLLRYLDIALHRDDRHVLVPVGHIKLEEHADGTRARLRAAMRDDLHEIPPFEPQARPPDPEYELDLLAAHGRIFYGERYYAHPAFDHSGLYAGSHPIVREGEGEGEGEGMHALAELPDYRVAEGETDVRGWALVTRDGLRAGTVDDLIVDVAAEKVRYALVSTDDGRAVLVPVGFLRIEESADAVRLDALAREDVLSLPARVEGPVTREEERALRAALDDRLARAGWRRGPDFHLPEARQPESS